MIVLVVGGNDERLDQSHHRRHVAGVGELAGGRREQQERRDEDRADHQPGLRRRQPAHLQLVGDQDGERELEQVVVGRTDELCPNNGPNRAWVSTRNCPAWSPSLLFMPVLSGLGCSMSMFAAMDGPGTVGLRSSPVMIDSLPIGSPRRWVADAEEGLLRGDRLRFAVRGSTDLHQLSPGRHARVRRAVYDAISERFGADRDGAR
jgi:hypothetical protein